MDASKWELNDGVVSIRWGRYGNYDMTFNKADKTMKGHGLPLKESDPNNW